MMLRTKRMYTVTPAVLATTLNAKTVEFPLIQAVLEGSQEGTIIVDDCEELTLALVVTKFGFTYAMGRDTEDRMWREAVELLLRHEALTNRYLLWYDPPAQCRPFLDALPDTVARARTRIRFHMYAAHETHELVSERLPKGAAIHRIDSSLFTKLTPFKLDLGSRFWRSDLEFLEKGFGFVAELDGEIASICYTACVANDCTEIDVATLEKFRGSGLARAVSKAFLKHCLQEGITPKWDCFDYNLSSRRLAASLGFEEVKRYPFYSLHT